MRNQILNYLCAGYPGLYLVSSEEERVEAELKAIAALLRHKLYAWSVTDGLVDLADGNTRQAPEPLEALALVAELPENTLVVLRDFHQFLDEPNPGLTRALKDLLRVGKTKGKALILLGCRLVLPPELERLFLVLHFTLPDKEILGTVLDNVAASGKQATPEGEQRDLLLDSATGLTCLEAENAFALSIAESKTLQPQIIAREKANAVKKNGLLEVFPAAASLDDIGGLELLKGWLLQRKDAFGAEARRYGLPNPKGLLIVGIPGTGKSLTAKATASVFNRPLLRLDAGRLFAGLVGQSEGNLRAVIATVEAIAPCVLWIDEIEKGFSGARSSGVADGGTASRVFGTFLSWMQEKTAPVFIVATANDVTQLPPELLRKGRFDELFFIDLPNEDERQAIWKLQVAKYGRSPDKFDLVALSRATEGFTGSEIEQLVIDSLYDAFSRREKPTDLSAMLVLNQTVPLSKLMGEQVAGLRNWAKGRSRLATAPKSDGKARKILVAA